MSDNVVYLKKGKEKAIRNRHHWIFSGAAAALPSFENGTILQVRAADNEPLGYAYFNRRSSILGRMISFGDRDPRAELVERIRSACALRRGLFDDSKTNAYRLVNAEGDAVPGLVADKYGDVLVIQVSTLGMEKLKPLVLETLVEILSPRTVYEKSTSPSRKEEGLPPAEKFVHGEEFPEVVILENGLRFHVDVKRGQKTGFFLDQREMRNRVRELAAGKRVLNCFSYTGGFSVAALKGGARSVDTVDSSEKCVEDAKRNFVLNDLSVEENGFFAADVFDFLRERELDHDLIVLDPPAFAKRKADVVQACRGYKDINRTAISKIPRGSLLLTCSCSHFVDDKLFQQVVFQAASETKRNVRVVGRHLLAPDHPINIFHPEGGYLKSLLLHVE